MLKYFSTYFKNKEYKDGGLKQSVETLGSIPSTVINKCL